MQTTNASFLVLILVIAATPVPAAVPARANDIDLMPDTWSATDALGRVLPTVAEAGPPRKDRTVGIFYFLWLGPQNRELYDISKLLAENPLNPTYGPLHAFHWWGQPLFGYYLSDDAWVIRKHAQLLADAGVDVMICDVTNALTYDKQYLTVCRVLDDMRKDGMKTPQIAFIANSRSAQTVQKLYDNFYSKNLYPDLWFRWLGKPLLLTPPDGLSPEVQKFFTIRHSWAWHDKNGWFKNGKDKWPWVDHYPQQPGWHESPDKPEEISVCVAQHPVSNIGRSFHAGSQPAPGQTQSAAGLCFAEQWKRALQVDPPFVFVTGWNEWIAQRFISKSGGQSFLGQRLPPGGTFFVDQYNEEFSRDIEPMAAGHGDDYYYQLVASIRRYKGVRPPPSPSAPKTIRIDGDFSDWADVRPDYLDTLGDTAHRDHPGYGKGLRYTDTTGRNDFVKLKVARDDRFISFYAETRDPITSFRDPHWMLLFIDADANHATGWQGYDYRVNAKVIDEHTTTVEKYAAGRWLPAGNAEYRLSANRLELAIPRPLIESASPKPDTRNPIPDQFDFHWADNMQNLDDIAEFTLHGDSAPNGRFNYRYIEQP